MTNAILDRHAARLDGAPLRTRLRATTSSLLDGHGATRAFDLLTA